MRDLSASDASASPRDNLVLVHSFPTNSILLSGLTEFLEDHFVVHFIDLPGFTRAVPPLEERPITIAQYARFLESEIERRSLDSYVLGGVSFGFQVANAARPKGHCKAILAMEPFLGVESLHLTQSRRLLLRSFLKVSLAVGLPAVFWRSDKFQAYLGRGAPPGRVECIIREIDAETFFETAYLLLSLDSPVEFQDIPYVLLINPEDTTVRYDHVCEVFRKGVQDLLIVESSVEHYPRELTKQYFVDRVSRDQIARLQSFLRQLNERPAPVETRG